MINCPSIRYHNDTLSTGEVVAGWNANLNCFQPGERSDSLKIISDPYHEKFLSDGPERAKAISGIGSGLQYASEKARREIVAMICDQKHPHILPDPTKAIAGIGSGLIALDEKQRSAIVQTALALEGRARAVAISGLGRGLKHLDTADCERLLGAARELSDVPSNGEIGEEQDDRSLAMYGLGVGAQEWAKDLSSFRRQRQHEKETSNSEAFDVRQRDARSL